MVANQADEIDLVNGKLDDQLKKLKEIQLRQILDNESEYWNAYSLAREVVNNDGTDDTSGAHWADQWFFDFSNWIGDGLLGDDTSSIVTPTYDKRVDEILDGIIQYSDFLGQGEFRLKPNARPIIYADDLALTYDEKL